MKQPPGFVDSNRPSYVCRLHKSIYGLKQAPRTWYSTLSSYLVSLGFHISKADNSLLIRRDQSCIMYVLIYVDDILVTGSDSIQINTLLQVLSSKFAIKDLGSLHYFLGIEAIPHGSGLFLSQQKYIREVLSRINFDGVKPITTPLAANTQLSKEGSSNFSDPTLYRSVVGALQYLTFTRPDISVAVNKVCQFMHNPTDDHWSAVKRILRYLKHTKTYGLLLRRPSTIQIQAFSDADWAGCPDDRRSTSGYCVFIGGNLC
ncbi:hypothetical protein ACHQM5_004323 [Ranunculus cassubicifolius]